MWLSLKNLPGSDTLDYLGDIGRADHGDALDEKVDMVLIDSDFEKVNIVAFFDLKADVFDFLVCAFDILKYLSAVLGRAD